MGQLIKLQDYISRYEQNIFLYPSRFVRLKKQQWQKLKLAWENNELTTDPIEEKLAGWEEEKEAQPFIAKLKGLLKREKKTEDVSLEDWTKEDSGEVKEEELLDFNPFYTFRPATEEQLKKQFLDQLFRFQMKWASSTIAEKSSYDKKYNFDERLKYFLQRFPDTFLVMFQPIFQLKNAPVETETIVITPREAWCISFLEAEDDAVFFGSAERFWMKKYKEQEKKILSPVISLNRTEKIVQQIFRSHEVDLPIRKAIISRNGYIDYPSSPYDLELIGGRSYEEWFSGMRNFKSPFKHMQLKAAQHLLLYCMTSSMKRYDWEDGNE